MRVVGIGGEPGTGKTTVMNAIIEELEGAVIPFQFQKLVKGYRFPEEKTVILGLYDGDTFSGTDRLSMAVVPRAIRFIRFLKKTRPSWKVIFEGDRLYTRKFFDAIKDKCELTLLELFTDDETKQNRYKSRNSNQSVTWLKGRKTKVENVARDYAVQRLENTEIDDLEQIKAAVLSA